MANATAWRTATPGEREGFHPVPARQDPAVRHGIIRHTRLSWARAFFFFVAAADLLLFSSLCFFFPDNHRPIQRRGRTARCREFDCCAGIYGAVVSCWPSAAWFCSGSRINAWLLLLLASWKHDCQIPRTAFRRPQAFVAGWLMRDEQTHTGRRGSTN